MGRLPERPVQQQDQCRPRGIGRPTWTKWAGNPCHWGFPGWTFPLRVWCCLGRRWLPHTRHAVIKNISQIDKLHLLKQCLWYPLRWRHNGRDSVSYHQPHGCLLNRLIRRRSKKTSKLRVTGLCAGNSPGTGEFPAQMASNAKNVSIWWRHHAQDPCWSLIGSMTSDVCVRTMISWISCTCLLTNINTLRPTQDGCHFPNDILKWIFLNENVWVSIKKSLKFVPRSPVNNIPVFHITSQFKSVIILTNIARTYPNVYFVSQDISDECCCCQNKADVRAGADIDKGVPFPANILPSSAEFCWGIRKRMRFYIDRIGWKDKTSQMFITMSSISAQRFNEKKMAFMKMCSKFNSNKNSFHWDVSSSFHCGLNLFISIILNVFSSFFGILIELLLRFVSWM